jgi:GTP cyclohydrolase II
VRVLTNQPRRLGGVSGFGLEIAEWVPLDTPDGVDSARAATP